MSRARCREYIERLSGKEKEARTDLGLELLSIVRKPGSTFSRSDIALWCGCTDVAIEIIEKRAIRRLRNYSMTVLKEL